MTPPKRIYLEFNNVPPCNFGALWYDAEVHEPLGENCAAYVLESAVQEEMAQLREKIRVMSMVTRSLASRFDEAIENNEYLIACLRSKQK